MHECVRTSLIAALVAVALGASSTTAAASDATLSAEVETVLLELRPTVGKFIRANENLNDRADITRLRAVTQEFRLGLRRYKWGTINRKASSSEGLAAKRLLLAAIRRYDLGLVAFHGALDAGRSDRSIDAMLKRAERRLTAAKERENEALIALQVAPESGVGVAFP